MNSCPILQSSAVAAVILLIAGTCRAALLAYEPFTNAPGTAIIGSAGGFGFSGAWQDYSSSQGIATNTAAGLSYTDRLGQALVTAGGGGFFRGLTSANNSMQPIRPFNFSRGTNGTDGVTTWISFLAVRQGPVVAGDNPYPRGANVPHDLNSGNVQKLAIGNSSGAATNTVGLIPLGNASNLRRSPVVFSRTNLIVVRVDHLPGTNDNAYLFVNPTLGVEPSPAQADTNSLGAFDFSFDRVRVFAGGNNGTSQPYAEFIVDEYRLGETYADVTPIMGPAPTNSSALLITNLQMVAGNAILRGTGGTNGGAFHLLGGGALAEPASNWLVLATNYFDAGGNFTLTNPIPPGVDPGFFRVRVAPAPAVEPPAIVSGPSSLTVTQGQTALFSVVAGGAAPLAYQWILNGNVALPGQTNSSLTLADVQAANAGAYAVQVSNAGGSVTSPPAALTVLSPPAITAQPADAAVLPGGSATFSVTANGTAPLRYQWFFNTNSPLAPATNASLTIAGAQTNNAGAYSVTVRNDYGAVTSRLAFLTVNDSSITNGAYFVSTSGSDTNPGTITRPFLTIGKGVTAIGTGGQLYLRGGTYALPTKLSLSKIATTNLIRIWAYPGETPLIDSTGNTSDGISVSGDGYHLKGLTVMNAGHNGINISGASNIVEACVVCANSNTGLHITGDANTAYNLILNCDSYRNYDAATHGQNADGFSAKWSFGPGNVFSGCRAWENADDGWDLWMGISTIVITNCWAYRQGTNVFGDTAWQGNGNGFKLGGNYVGAPHRLVRSLAFLNMANGVDQNNNIAGQALDNNTSWANRARNFSMAHGTNTTPHVVRNNLSFAGGSSDQFTSGTLSTNNSWQIISSPAANASDVQSVDYSGVTGPRQADGSLPTLPFMRPVLGGRLVDKGVNDNVSYSGSAPDLGAFETSP